MTENKKGISDIAIGGLAAILVAGIIIYSIETERSLLQIFIGFAIFVLPITFLSSYFSKIGSFVFVFISIIIVYLASKYMLRDIWLGAILAMIIGGSAFYFRVNKVKTFDAEDYIEKAKNHHRNKKNE